MEFEHSLKNGVLILIPKIGSLDAKVSSEFKEEILKLIQKENVHQILLNLGHINFIDSSGLGSLISLLRWVNSEKGEIKLLYVNKPIRTMFELVSMNKIFDMHDSMDEALNSFKNKNK